MHFYPTERIALFIDGANLYATAKSLGFDIDYKRLLGLFRQKGQLVRALYYTALAEEQEYSSIRPLIDWLDYNGFSMVTKPTKEFTDATGRRKVKGNMDIELAVDAMRLSDSLDHIVIFSGDGDFRSLVAALQQKGKRVSVVSTLQTQPPMVADELRRQADQFIDLADLEDQVGRSQSGGGANGGRTPREGRGFSARAGQVSAPRDSNYLGDDDLAEGRGLTRPTFDESTDCYGWGCARYSILPPRLPRSVLVVRALVAYRRENEAKEPKWFNGAGAVVRPLGRPFFDCRPWHRGGTERTARGDPSQATMPAISSTKRCSHTASPRVNTKPGPTMA